MSCPLDESENPMIPYFGNVGTNFPQLHDPFLTRDDLVIMAGKQHAYVKLHKWMLEILGRKGRMVTVSEIFDYLEGVIDVSNDEGVNNVSNDEGVIVIASDDEDEIVASDDGLDGGQDGGGSGHESDEAMLSSPSADEADQNLDNYVNDMAMDFTSDGNYN